MSKYFILALAILICTSSCAQGNKVPEMIQVKWVLESEQMSGVGNHSSLPEKSTLILYPDFTWHCSAPIDGLREGRWKESSGSGVTLYFADGKTGELSLTPDQKLKLVRQRGLAKTIIVWRKA